MGRIKKIIVLLVIFILFLICILIMAKSLLKDKPQEIGNTESDISGDYIKNMQLVDDYITYFSVEKMLNNYIKNVQTNNSEGIYYLLDQKYIRDNNLSLENILSHVSEITNYNSQAKIIKMYGQEDMDQAIYHIYCILKEDNNRKECYFTIYEDRKNLRYSVAQIKKEVYEQNIKNKNQKLQIDKIEANDYNQTLYSYLTEEQLVTRYFEDIIENMLYYPENAYNMLDENYRIKCFPTLEDFKLYIENKREVLLSYNKTELKPFGEFESMEQYLLYLAQKKNLKLSEYQIRKKAEYNRYICLDNFENYYELHATTPLNYTYVLDNYALPSEEYAEAYNMCSEVEKVVLNIQRFFEGINDKKYGYSYGVLAESFKNNKYETKEDFVNYIKQNFFEKNKIEYISYEKENGVYIYKIKITDEEGKSKEEKAYNMIIRLKSGTDFELSFGK